MTTLTDDQMKLLTRLINAEECPFSMCCGPVLDHLVTHGLAIIYGTGDMTVVAATDAGRAKLLPPSHEDDEAEAPDVGEMLEAIEAAIGALAEGQLKAVGNDKTEGEDAEPNTIFFDALRTCRSVKAAADAYMEA